MNESETLLKKGIEKAIKKYKCLQERFYSIENTSSYVNIYWHPCKDRYVNVRQVIWIAKFLRRYTTKPIYSSLGIIKV